jgi:hypothetical protein
MGDMADALNEAGEELWLLHLSGQCGEDRCPYCEGDDDE